jgi:serine/threonine protein kinase
MADSNLPRTGLQIGQKVGSCDVVKFIADGTFGRVFHVINTVTRLEFACKEVDLAALGSDEIEAMKNEVAIHQQLKHLNIIQFYDTCSHNNFLYINMELAASCLFDEIKGGLHPALWRPYFFDLITGVEFLHSVGVVHHDIKTENLLISCDQRLKIADFGLAAHFVRGTPGRPRNTNGTRPFMAPEMLQSDEPYRLELPDVWACGIVLIEMMTKKTPWPSTDSSEYSDWKMGILRSPFDLISKTPLDLLRMILQDNPSHRIYINDIKNHPWFTSN